MTQDIYTILIGSAAYEVPMGHSPKDCDCDPCLIAFAALSAPCKGRMALGEHEGADWVICTTHAHTIMEYPDGNGGVQAVHDEPVRPLDAFLAAGGTYDDVVASSVAWDNHVRPGKDI